MNEFQMKSLTQRMMRISKAAWNYSRQSLVSEKLSNIQYNIVYVIQNNPGISQDGVATFLHLDKSSVAKLVVKLIDMGYVKREVNPEDHREYQLFLTEKGESEILELEDILVKWEKDVFGDSDSDQYKEIINCLKNIEDKIF